MYEIMICTLMQILREMNLDDIVLVYSVFDNAGKSRLLECISPLSGEIVKGKSLLLDSTELTEKETDNINSIIQETLKEKCKSFLRGEEDVLL